MRSPVRAPRRMYGADGWARRYTRLLVASDVLVVAAIMGAAHAIRFGWDPFTPIAGTGAHPYWVVTALISILWLVNLAWVRSREARILGHGPQEFQRVVNAGWRTFALVAVVGFLTQWWISRGYMIFAIPIGTIVLLGSRYAWRWWIHRQRDSGALQAQVVVAGPMRTSQDLMRRLRHAPRAGFHVVGLCLPPSSDEALDDDLADIPLLGTIADAANAAITAGAEYVILSGNDEMSLNEARKLGWSLEGTGIGLIVAPAMVDVAGPRVMMSPVEGLPLLHVDPPTFSGGKYFLKALADRTWAVLFLLVAALPMLVIAVAIKLTTPGPVLFRQQRLGLDLRPFQMLKFRSMYVDAEQRLATLKAQSQGNQVLFKMKQDPRITPLGRILRRFSLDELPQLLNVLKGDMSLVGPRPPLESEALLWDEPVARRQMVKPGITGLWQVSGRSDLSWDESVRLDLYYAENWSLGGDVLIIGRTVAAVLGRRGAY